MTALVSETEFDVDAVLSGLLRASPAYTVVLSTPDLTITDANRHLQEALNRPLETLRGRRLSEIDGIPQALVDYALAAQARVPLRTTIETECGDIPVEASVSPLPSANRLILYCVDLRARNDRRPRDRREHSFKQVFESTTNGMFLLNKELNIIQANPRASSLMRCERDALTNATFASLLSEDDAVSLPGIVAASAQSADEPHSREMRMRRSDGSEFWASVGLMPLHASAGSSAGYLAQIEDIGERKRHEEKLEQLAYYDPLTGLANRRQLMDRVGLTLGRVRRHGSMSALLYLDLDSFKKINDEFGHAAGDLLLETVSQRLKEATRTTDLVARPGGDEFAILLEDITQPEDAERLACKLIETVRSPVAIHRQSLVVTCSIGITLMPQDSTCVETILANADAAMYQAKRAGRNRYRFFAERMNTQATHRQVIERDLRQALLDEALEIYLQPQVCIATGRLAGAEVLCRWHHPELGDIAPDEFIHVAEETGLIISLGEWVIDRACEACVQLSRKAGRAIRVSVNVSAAQLRDPDFVDKVRKLLETYGLEERQLELELEESALIENVHHNKARLEELHSLGVSLSIDDFGTGYSSFGCLKSLPLATLKIDRSFVSDIPASREDKAIASGLIVMAHRMQMSVVAEGVETQAQLDFLRGHGCDLAQGFYLGKPAPLGELEIV